MHNLLKFIVTHVVHAQLNGINSKKKKKTEREERRKKQKKNEVSNTHKSSDDETLSTTGKISTRRIHKHHEKPTLKLVMRC